MTPRAHAIAAPTLTPESVVTDTDETLALYGLTDLPRLLDEYARALADLGVYGDCECEAAVIDCRKAILDTVALCLTTEVGRTIGLWSKRAAVAVKMMDAAKVALTPGK